MDFDSKVHEVIGKPVQEADTSKFFTTLDLGDDGEGIHETYESPGWGYPNSTILDHRDMLEKNRIEEDEKSEKAYCHRCEKIGAISKNKKGVKFCENCGARIWEKEKE